MFEELPRAARRQAHELSVLEQQVVRAGIVARRGHAQETGWLDGAGASNRQGMSGAVWRSLQADGFTPSPGYLLPEGVERRWHEKGIHPAQWSLFHKAHSDEHLEWLEQLAVQNQDDAAVLSEFGVLGQLALGLSDVGGLVLDAASGGLGTAARAGRVGNLIRSGGVAAGASAAVMGSASRYNPEIGLNEIAQASALSFALGGLLNARRGAQNRVPVHPEAVKRAAGWDELRRPQMEGMGAARTSHSYDNVNVIPNATRLRNDTPVEEHLLEAAHENAHLQPHFSHLRIDLAARMGRSKSTFVRELGRRLFRDGVGYTDKDVAVAESTGEFAKRHLAVLETQWRRGLNEHWDAYRKENGIFFWNSGARKAFNMEVGRAVRGDTDVSPAALKAAQPVRESLNTARKLAQDSGLEGFDAIADNPHYLPRYWSESGFQRLFGDVGVREEDVIQTLLKPALRRAWEASGRTLEIDDELLDAVATAYIKRAQANFVGDGMTLLHKPLNLDDLAELRQMLDEAGVSEPRSRDLLNKFERSMEDAGKIDRGKRRLDLDENHTAVLKRYSREFSYGEEVPVKVSDLFDNDVESVLSRYMREITGWSALAQKVGIRSRSELDTVLNRAKVEARKAGEKDTEVERMLEIGINATFGRSTESKPGSRASRIGRFIRNWNFSRVMNQVGFTMFAELGPVIAHSGLRNVLHSLPEIPALLKRGRDGLLESKDARIMEELFAPGTDLIRNPPFLRLDEDGSVALPTFEKAPWLDKVTHGANHITNIFSGMAPMTAVLQRVAGRATLLRMMEMARKARLSAAEVQRLRTWGLDDAGQKQVFAYLKTIRKIEDINPQALPLGTRERLSAFMYRATRHQVLEGDASDSIGLMHGVTGRIVLQFRTFMFNSYTRHFLNSIHHWNDWATYQMVILSTAFAGIGWASRAYLNTIGDEKARERLLTPENFVKNGIAQSSWASVIPAVTDFVWGDLLRNAPVFQGNRSTGLQNGVMGIPTMDLLNKAVNSTGMIGSLLDADEKITEEQMRDFWRIWWFSNLTGLRNIVETGIDAGFPDNPDGSNRK